MKRLLILSTLAAVLASNAGCYCWDRWFRRGDNCVPDMCNPCEDACVGAPMVSGGCASGACGTTVVPGPEAYVPATVP